MAPVAVGAGVVAAAASIAASPLMPLGLARRAEPDPGVSLDGIVLALGCVGVTVIVAALAVLVAWPASPVGGLRAQLRGIGSRPPIGVVARR